MRPVDRGPGTAATIGNATFGGTISNISKAPLADMTLTPSVTYGSFGTSVIGAEFDTAVRARFHRGARRHLQPARLVRLADRQVGGQDL